MPVLLCDLDDTLFDHDRATRDSLANLRCNHQVLTCWSLEELDARHRVLLEALHLDVLAGRLLMDDARRERFARLLAQAGVHDDLVADQMASAYRMTYAANWHAVPGAIEFLQAVRADGHVVVVVTNNGVREQQLKLQRCGIGPWIDVMVTSEEAGVSKPGRAIFEQALKSVGAQPTDAVMLGDAWGADVEGARAAGVTPVWFNPSGLPSPDPTVVELASLAPAAAAIAVLRGAGLGRAQNVSRGVDEARL
ncbi:MAG: HAD-IA family hydrolase [Vicinamibacterales bacterium]